MLNTLELKLYKSLIDSDFFLLNSNLKIGKNITGIQKIKALDVLNLLKTLKQFIRILQFLKKSDKNKLVIQVQNKHTFFLIKEFLLEYPTKFSIDLQQSFSLKKTSGSTDTKLLLLLDSYKVSDFSRFLHNKFLSKFFLIQNIDNIKSTKGIGGNYKILNDLLDFKKVIFTLILLQELLNSDK